MDVRRLANLTHYWLMRNANETQRMRIESDLEAPLGPDDTQADGDLFEKALAGMM